MYEYRAVVQYVHDGDTVTVNIDLGFKLWWGGGTIDKPDGIHIRMFGINAPELANKPSGPAARDFLMGYLPPGQVVLLHTHKDQADKYGGRYDGTIFCGTWSGDTLLNPINLNDLMISSGHAVPLVV
jgi:endonuclease YncB( thermonuclease family)